MSGTNLAVVPSFDCEGCPDVQSGPSSPARRSSRRGTGRKRTRGSGGG